MDKEHSPLCRLCKEEDETFDHWVGNCPVLWTERTGIFMVVTNKYIILPNEWSLDKSIKIFYIPVLNSVLERGVILGDAECVIPRPQLRARAGLRLYV